MMISAVLHFVVHITYSLLYARSYITYACVHQRLRYLKGRKYLKSKIYIFEKLKKMSIFFLMLLLLKEK